MHWQWRVVKLRPLLSAYCPWVREGLYRPHQVWHWASVFAVSSEGPHQFFALYNKQGVLVTYSNPDHHEMMKENIKHACSMWPQLAVLPNRSLQSPLVWFSLTSATELHPLSIHSWAVLVPAPNTFVRIYNRSHTSMQSQCMYLYIF